MVKLAKVHAPGQDPVTVALAAAQTSSCHQVIANQYLQVPNQDWDLYALITHDKHPALIPYTQ